jgi:hypothetical protein
LKANCGFPYPRRTRAAEAAFAQLSKSKLNAWNPRYKTRYKTADIVEKLENGIKLLLFDLQNPAVRTTCVDQPEVMDNA